MTTRVNGQQITGTCKFWNAVKGFGFVVPVDGGADIFVSQHDLVTNDTRFRALTAGQRVEFVYTVMDDGKALGKTVTGPGGAALPSFKDMFSAKREIESAKPRDPNKNYGVVKWFNTATQHGFITPDEGGTDVFMHFTECLKGIVPQEGDAVEFNLKTDRNQKLMAGEVKNKTQHTAGPRKGAMQQQGVPQMQQHPQMGLPQQQGYAYGRKTGIVKFFDEAKGYGFIVADMGGRDIHVHKTNVMGGILATGEAVEYDEQQLNGKLQAVLVQKSTQQAGAQMVDPSQQQQYFAPNVGTANARYY